MDDISGRFTKSAVSAPAPAKRHFDVRGAVLPPMIDVTPWSAIWAGMGAKPNHVVGFNTNRATDPSAIASKLSYLTTFEVRPLVRIVNQVV